MANSKASDTGSSIKSILIGVLIIGAVVGLILILAKSNIFDTSGGYIKDMAKEGDVAGFVESAKVIPYPDLLNGEVEDFENVAIKYYATVVDREMDDDKTAIYTFNVTVNAKDSQKLSSNLYPKNANKEATVVVKGHASEGYSRFTVGDNVYIYGELTEFVETEKYDKVPFLELKKVVLDDEVFAERDKEISKGG